VLLIIGDVVKLKPRFRPDGDTGVGIIIEIDSFEGQGWYGYDYVVMMASGQMLRITDSCVEEIYSSGIIPQTSGSLI
jgi:hypothetical protein